MCLYAIILISIDWTYHWGESGDTVDMYVVLFVGLHVPSILVVVGVGGALSTGSPLAIRTLKAVIRGATSGRLFFLVTCRIFWSNSFKKDQSLRFVSRK